jgi:hypothetical protein
MACAHPTVRGGRTIALSAILFQSTNTAEEICRSVTSTVCLKSLVLYTIRVEICDSRLLLDDAYKAGYMSKTDGARMKNDFKE